MKENYSSQSYFNKLDRYFRAANYLSVAQLYLLDNPLLRRPLEKKDVKKKIVGGMLVLGKDLEPSAF